ncbi:MAG: CotH kinase family protein [Planctomycetes bacterium]|nr:CotH kinase family protein [Planctomycetota bacterium]
MCEAQAFPPGGRLAGEEIAGEADRGAAAPAQKPLFLSGAEARGRRRTRAPLFERLLFGLLLVPWAICSLAGQDLPFRRGDSNADGRVDIADSIFSLRYMFQGWTAPPCLDAADANDDGDADISDPIVTLLYLFQGGRALPSPGPQDCGPDPTPDDLACSSYTACPPNQPPTASFTATPASGRAPLDIAFDASGSADPEGVIASFEWDFGDGGLGSGSPTSHVFLSEGTYSVVLQVTDDGGASATSTVSISISAPNHPPSLDPIGDQVVLVGNSLPIRVTASDPDGDPIALSVDPLPTNATFTAATGEFVFTPDSAQVGVISLTFSATDGFGGVARELVNIAVREPATPPEGDSLSTAEGCPGVFNPNQVLDYHLSLDPADWTALQADASNSLYFSAQLACDGEAPLVVGVCRKPCGGGKVGLRIDVNRFVADQSYFGLKNLVLESGTQTATLVPSMRKLLAEYLAWRLMQLSGAVSSRAALARVHVNGEFLGVYIAIEAVDKRLLRSRLGDDTGWLWEEGSSGGEWRTNETVPDPYAPYFCFFGEAGMTCATPPLDELAGTLPSRLDLGQLLTVGAVNALMGNRNGPLAQKDNYYFYDFDGGPRLYLPWDLDQVMERDLDVFSSWNARFTYVLFDRWQDLYAEILGDLLAGPLALARIHEEIDRALALAGPSLESDPHYQDASAARTAADLRSWWTARHDDVAGQLSARRCRGPFDTSSVADYRLTMSSANWAQLTADSTNSVYYQAELACNDHVPMNVAVRRKRSGGTEKVGIKIDLNRYDDGQSFFGLNKLSLENGISEGDSESSVEALATEYLAWRLMVLSGAKASRTAFVRLHVNGAPLGIYVSVEQVDKPFLKTRLGNDEGWLYKKSGGDDGYRTNEDVANPFEADLCFWANGAHSCAIPPAEELAVSLPQHLDIEQMLRMGAVNVLMSNTDGPLVKDNNYYFYDYEGGARVYLPWDLDTVMKDALNVFTSFEAKYTDVLFTHWEDDYEGILTELLAWPLRLEAIHGEIDNLFSVAGDLLDSDPYLDGDSSAETRVKMRDWWSARHAQAAAQVAAH